MDMCETCRFWKKDTFSTGDCRRHAPSIKLVIRLSEYRGQDAEREWPLTDKRDWCGDYQQKPEGAA